MPNYNTDDSYTGFTTESSRIAIDDYDISISTDTNFVKEDGETISEINKRLKLNRKDISRLTTKHNNINKRLGDIEAKYDTDINNIDNYINALSDSICKEQEQITQMNSVIDKMEDELIRSKKINLYLTITSIIEIAAILGSYYVAFIR